MSNVSQQLLKWAIQCAFIVVLFSLGTEQSIIDWILIWNFHKWDQKGVGFPHSFMIKNHLFATKSTLLSLVNSGHKNLLDFS